MYMHKVCIQREREREKRRQEGEKKEERKGEGEGVERGKVRGRKKREREEREGPSATPATNLSLCSHSIRSSTTAATSGWRKRVRYVKTTAQGVR